MIKIIKAAGVAAPADVTVEQKTTLSVASMINAHGKVNGPKTGG